MSLESDISTLSGDNQSLVSQETTIIREPRDEALKNGEVKTHKRGVSTAQSTHVHRYDKLHPSEVKDVLLIYLFVVKYIGEEQIISWWQKSTDTDVLNFFIGLEMCLGCFKYVGKRNMVVIKTTVTDNVKPKPTKAHTLPARMNPSDIMHENTSTLVIHTSNRENLASGENEITKKRQVILEQHLSNEVGLIVLDYVGLYCMYFRKNLLINDGDNATMRKIFDIYLSFLQIGQSESLFKHVFASLRSFINSYSSILFQGKQ